MEADGGEKNEQESSRSTIQSCSERTVHLTPQLHSEARFGIYSLRPIIFTHLPFEFCPKLSCIHRVPHLLFCTCRSAEALPATSLVVCGPKKISKQLVKKKKRKTWEAPEAPVHSFPSHVPHRCSVWLCVVVAGSPHLRPQIQSESPPHRAPPQSPSSPPPSRVVGSATPAHAWRHRIRRRCVETPPPRVVSATLSRRGWATPRRHHGGVSCRHRAGAAAGPRQAATVHGFRAAVARWLDLATPPHGLSSGRWSPVPAATATRLAQARRDCRSTQGLGSGRREPRQRGCARAERARPRRHGRRR